MNLVLAVVYLSYEQELCSDEREVNKYTKQIRKFHNRETVSVCKEIKKQK